MIARLPAGDASPRIRPVIEADRGMSRRRKVAQPQSKESVMKKMLAAMLLCCASTVTFAQSAAPEAGNPQRMERMAQQLQTRFANANTTRDGKLTKQQADAGMPMVARHFDEIDTQKAGYVTLPQIAAFMQERGAAH
jgi:hypothetical protein